MLYRHLNCLLTTLPLYLMLLSSENLFRHFWMMWSARSDSGIRFSDCLSFSKDLTSRQRHTTTLTCSELFDQYYHRHCFVLTHGILKRRHSRRFWLLYLHIAPLLVRDHGHAVDPGQPAVLQQSLLRLNTRDHKKAL